MTESNGLSIRQVKQTRVFIVIGMIILSCFIFPDLALLPQSLEQHYLDVRLLLQLPVCLLVFFLTFFKFYQSNTKIHQIIICTAVLVLIYGNYWLILYCYQQQNFAFPYEGTVIYSLFVLFVFRIPFNYSLIFVLITLLGFAYLVFSYPIYGDTNQISLGFVVSGLIVGLIGVYQIEGALKQLAFSNQKLVKLSQIDSLSNILNRGAYEDKFTELLEMSKRKGDFIAVFMIDLDNFKTFNDGYGHQKGDEIIKLQAKMLKSIFRRATDVVARYGGEEFIVVTCNNSVEQCEKYASAILDGWRDLDMPHGKVKGQKYVTCSVGFYRQQVDQFSNKDNLVEKADKALYQAKKAGRNQFMQYCD